MGYGPGTYSAIGLIVAGDRAEFALVKDSSRPVGQRWSVYAHSGCDPETPNEGGCSEQTYETFDLAHAGLNEADVGNRPILRPRARPGAKQPDREAL